MHDRDEAKRKNAKIMWNTLNRRDIIVQRITESIQSLKEQQSILTSMDDSSALLQDAINVGAFFGKEVILHNIKDTCRNLIFEAVTGSRAGARYSSSTKTLFETVWNMGGPSMHGVVSRNLNGPTLKTSTQKKSSRMHGPMMVGYLTQIRDSGSGFVHVTKSSWVQLT